MAMVGKGKGQGLGEPVSRGTRYAQRNPPPIPNGRVFSIPRPKG